MRIMLCTPMVKTANEKWMPLGLCYIASALIAQGHEVKIFDRYVLGAAREVDWVDDAMCKETGLFKPDIIGFSTYTPAIYDTIRAVKAVRQIHEGIIVLGGHHATVYPKLTLERIPEADMVIAGEGELSFAMLVRGEDKKTIPGLFWREKQEIMQSDAKVIRTDLSILHLPAYELLDMDFYTARNVYTIRSYFRSVGCVISSRGCNNRCSFCTESLTFSGGVRLHSIEFVIDNIKLLTEKYKCTGITFYDNNFLADKKYAKSVLNAVIDEGLNKNIVYCVQARADDIDEELAALMKKAGFTKVEIGVESYSQDALDEVGKNLSVKTTEKAIEICRENDISVQANLIMGFENETISSLEATRLWVKRLNVDNFKWGQLKIYPGTLLYRQNAYGKLEECEWTRENIDSFFSKDHLSGLSAEQREAWVKKKLRPFRRWVHHRGIIKRNPFFTWVNYYLGKITGRWN